MLTSSTDVCRDPEWRELGFLSYPLSLTPPPSRVQTISSTGSTDSTRVRLSLTLTVTKTHFATSATSSTTTSNPNETTAVLNISGRVCNENDWVRLGAFHTLDLEGGSHTARRSQPSRSWAGDVSVEDSALLAKWSLSIPLCLFRSLYNQSYSK